MRNAYLTEERMERWRRPVLVAATVGLVVWFVMLNLSSGLVEKLGGPYFDYLPSGPEEFTRPQMLDTMYWFRFGHTLGALAFGLILVGLVRYSDWWLSRFWSWHRFQWLGRLSYTLYVWHALPYIILMALLGGADPSPAVQLARTPILIAAAFAVSLPVYYLVELRVLRMKLRFASEKEVLDLRTGKMVQVDHADEIASADRTLSPGRDRRPRTDRTELSLGGWAHITQRRTAISHSASNGPSASSVRRMSHPNLAPNASITSSG